MLFPIGFIIVMASVIGGYVMHGGRLSILWQPNEVIIICGAAIGAFLIANPIYVVKDILKSLKLLLRGKPYNKDDYLELIAFIFKFCRFMKTKGMLAIESHIENPENSDIFQDHPEILSNPQLVQFICDYTRLLTVGVMNAYQVEDLMEKDIEVYSHELHTVTNSIATVGDGLPALGIVAAVLGIITTMQSITEPPEILGALIGAALVGTFLGILLSYGCVSPIAQFIDKYNQLKIKYLECVKTAMIAYMQGHAPTIIVEFARKTIPLHDRPSFKEVENVISNSTNS